MILKSKKELQDFIERTDLYIDFLIRKLNNYNIKGNNIGDFENKIDKIEKFYQKHYFEFNEQERSQL